MRHRHPLDLDLYQAEFLARMHYGLEPKAGAKGRTHGISKRTNNLQRRGFIADGELTELGLRALARFCLGRLRGPGEFGRRDLRDHFTKVTQR